MKRTILMYGRTRAGKTSQLTELAEWVKATTGKKTLVYSIDKGGVGPLNPYIELGIIDLVQQGDTNPFMFLSKLAKGQVRDKAGKWIPADLSQYGMIGNESLTGFGDALMNDLAEKASRGVNIGGAANVNFTIESDGESLKVGGNNMAHYGIVQTRILDEVWKSQKLDVPFLVWTASASKEEDGNFGGKVIGPAVVGKALTSEMPRQFDLCFRLDCLPSSAGKPEKHIMYLGNSVDQNAGNAVTLGNTRLPLGAPDLPATIEPASIVSVLKKIEEAEKVAMDNIRKKVSQAGPTFEQIIKTPVSK